MSSFGAISRPAVIKQEQALFVLLCGERRAAVGPGWFQLGTDKPLDQQVVPTAALLVPFEVLLVLTVPCWS